MKKSRFSWNWLTCKGSSLCYSLCSVDRHLAEWVANIGHNPDFPINQHNCRRKPVRVPKRINCIQVLVCRMRPPNLIHLNCTDRRQRRCLPLFRHLLPSLKNSRSCPFRAKPSSIFAGSEDSLFKSPTTLRLPRLINGRKAANDRLESSGLLSMSNPNLDN